MAAGAESSMSVNRSGDFELRIGSITCTHP
jgi:hypothetical protein